MRFDENTLMDNRGKSIIRVFHSTVPAGQRLYWDHHHTECELSVFLSGAGIYTVGELEYEFRQGDVFLFNSDEVHCVTDIYPGQTFHLLNIHFEPRILWTGRDLSDLCLLKLFFARSIEFQNRIDRDNPATAQIREQIDLLEQELSNKRAGYQLIAQFRLFFALTCLLRDYDYITQDAVYTRYENTIQQLERTLNYIDDNLENKLTLDELARIAAMSKTYFSTVFKKFNGLSPWEYITIKRVEKAIVLLKTTTMTKLDIADHCGFGSSSNFYKAFNKVTGKQPGEYRPLD